MGIVSRYNSNHRNTSSSTYGYSNIEKYLKEEIDFLLAPSANQLNEVDFNDIYISVPSAEDFLSSALTYSKSDKVLYFTGLTGSGKSMILKKVFNYHGISPEVCNNSLIIPFSFDNFLCGTPEPGVSEKGIESVYTNMLSSSCELLERSIPNLKLVQNNEADFLEIVRKSRADFTQVPDVWPRPSLNERIRFFMTKNPIPFNTSVLKYYLNQDTCTINNIVILVDDVEGAGENQELTTVKTAYRIITCLENTPKLKKWSVHLIISCRNYVYRLILSNNFSAERQQIETYTESENFHLEKSPLITDIIFKRYQAIISKDRIKSEKWKTALNTVLAILTGIDSSLGEFILNLKIRNIRKALAVIKQIIYNKQWIQRDYSEEIAGAFTIDSVKDYNITPATLIRAIGMGESQIYCSNISNIPNVMYNENETDLYPLLIIKHSLGYINTEELYASWNNTIDLCSLYRRITNIFGESNNSHTRSFITSAEHLIQSRLLLRSIDQLQSNAIPVNETNVHEVTKVYISNAAVDIWNLLSQNSVLFEMYMDDIWLDNTLRPARKKRFRGFDLDNFSIAMKYLDVLIEKEIKLRNHARNLGKFDEYIELFGRDTISRHLLNGLMNSFMAFYKNDVYEQQLIHELVCLEQKVKGIK